MFSIVQHALLLVALSCCPEVMLIFRPGTVVQTGYVSPPFRYGLMIAGIPVKVHLKKRSASPSSAGLASWAQATIRSRAPSRPILVESPPQTSIPAVPARTRILQSTTCSTCFELCLPSPWTPLHAAFPILPELLSYLVRSSLFSLVSPSCLFSWSSSSALSPGLKASSSRPSSPSVPSPSSQPPLLPSSSSTSSSGTTPSTFFTTSPLSLSSCPTPAPSSSPAP